MDTLNFLKETIRIMPEFSRALISCSSNNFESILKDLPHNRISNVDFEIILNNYNKEKLIALIPIYNIQNFIERITIKVDEKIIFEGFDCMDYGQISRQINLPENFIEDYIDNGLCDITDKWL